MPSRQIFREKHGNHGPTYAYVENSGSPAALVEVDYGLKSGKFMKIVRESFLPYGFPESVSEDYISYQLWDTLQAFCSTMSGILTTQAVMKGVGVGDNLASPLAATVTWILKDGVGMFGKITFAWWKGTFLDSDFKKWRFFADLLNDFALTLELLLFYYPEFATVVLCMSSSMKAIVGVAGGATRAAITQHQAVRGNMADVSAKDGSQETCVNLIASMLSLLLLTYFNTSRIIWPLFLWLTAFHIFANYRAVRSIVMKTVNAARYRELLHLYLFSDKVAEPHLINQLEPVLLGQGKTDLGLCNYNILLGTTIQHILKSNSFNQSVLEKIIQLYRTNKYIVIHDSEKGFIYVILHKEANSVDVLKSYFHAVLLGVLAHTFTSPDKRSITSNRMKLLQSETYENKFLRHIADLQNKSILPLLKVVNHVVESEFNKFKSLAEMKGWDMTNHNLPKDEWCAEW